MRRTTASRRSNARAQPCLPTWDLVEPRSLTETSKNHTIAHPGGRFQTARPYVRAPGPAGPADRNAGEGEMSIAWKGLGLSLLLVVACAVPAKSGNSGAGGSGGDDG